jgi:ferredoxin, 2Fe-2S
VTNGKNAKTVVFLPQKKKCSFDGSPSLLEVAVANNLPLNHSCGGMGSCTTCLVHVKDGLNLLHPRNEVEREHAQMRGFQPYERLACQTGAEDGLVVVIPAPKD